MLPRGLFFWNTQWWMLYKSYGAITLLRARLRVRCDLMILKSKLIVVLSETLFTLKRSRNDRGTCAERVAYMRNVLWRTCSACTERLCMHKSSLSSVFSGFYLRVPNVYWTDTCILRMFDRKWQLVPQMLPSPHSVTGSVSGRTIWHKAISWQNTRRLLQMSCRLDENFAKSL